MKSAIALCVLFFAALAVARPGEEHYTDRYDTVNLDEILENRAILVSYINCVLEKGKCTPDAKELREHIKDALENECVKCTEAQKKGTRRVIKHMINKEPEFWTELCDKYDPERKYTHKYEKELREVQA